MEHCWDGEAWSASVEIEEIGFCVLHIRNNASFERHIEQHHKIHIYVWHDCCHPLPQCMISNIVLRAITRIQCLILLLKSYYHFFVVRLSRSPFLPPSEGANHWLELGWPDVRVPIEKTTFCKNHNFEVVKSKNDMIYMQFTTVRYDRTGRNKLCLSLV